MVALAVVKVIVAGALLEPFSLRRQQLHLFQSLPKNVLIRLEPSNEEGYVTDERE